MIEKERLFEAFPPVSTEEWMEKIEADLKGADFNKKMVWRTNEGFQVMPFYRSEDLKSVSHPETLPGDFPYTRGGKAGNRWFVRQNIHVTDYGKANKKALEVLMNGIDSLGFIIDNPESITEDNVTKLLEGIHLDSISLNFLTDGKAREVVKILTTLLTSGEKRLTDVKGAVEADPLGRLMVNGSLCVPVSDGMDYLAALVNDSMEMPNMRVVQVNGANFSNAGADIVRELAFTLSQGNEYLSQLTDRDIPVDVAASKMGFTMGVGSNYFMEIAKLRAARLLWATIVKGYNPSDLFSCRMYIHSVTSRWNKTVFDPYVNMLRTQTEAMSAALGGTDSLTVDTFDAVFAEPDRFSERIARNQQLLLKEESHFDVVADPGAGSYYIEKLTDMITDGAWKLFLETEERGGFLNALREGFIQSSVEVMADKRREDMSKRKEILLGTNQYPSASERISERAEPSRFQGKRSYGETEVKPLVLFRGAEEFEQLRLATDKAAVRPSVFLLTIGNPAMRMARSQFAANFFACAGYSIIAKGPFKNVTDGVNAALESKASLVVVCSSDEEYPVVAPEVYKGVDGNAIVVVAGAPPCMDDLKKTGIEHFISVRSNVLSTLKSFHKLLGITI